ncbi:M28 family peptidase [bacterium]|nr:M28 family peptidase [bacterium]
MKQQHKKFTLKLMCISLLWSSILLAGPISNASPGAAILTPEQADHYLDNQPVVLWENPEFILVLPEILPAAKTVFPSRKKYDLYLVRGKPAILEQDFTESSIKTLNENWFLLQIPADISREIILPEDSVYLGYPSSRIVPNNTPTIPNTIIRSSQVQEMVNAINQTQLITDLISLTDFQTRNSYTQGCLDAAQWLRTEFETLGLEVTLQEHDREMGPNVIAEKTGLTKPGEIVIICCHYDSISLQPQTLAPGADDNGTGTTATLNAARVMAGVHFERTIRFIAFSGEEQGLRGSQAYAQKMAATGEVIIGVVNLDMIGYVDEVPEELEVIGNEDSSDLVDLFVFCAEEYTDLPTNRVIDGSISASDHSPFWNQGYKAMLGIEDHPLNYPYYHSIEDTVDKIDPEFLTLCTRAATATTAQLATPEMEIVSILKVNWDDSAGDNDGYLDPNETISVWVEMINNSDEISGPISLTMLCLAGNQYISFQNNVASIPALLPGQQANNYTNPFVLTIDEIVPEFSELTCIAALQCDAPHSSGYFFYGTITSYDWHDTIFEFPMDVEPDWNSNSNIWEWGIPGGQGGNDHGNPDPHSGYTGDRVLGTSLAGDYPGNIYSIVTSPVLDFSEVRYAELHFKRWLNIEHPDYDQAGIWISNSDGTQQIWGNKDEIIDNQWQTIMLDISEHADGRDDIQIEFSLQSDDGWEYSGWNIDDIRIAGLAPSDPTPHPETIGIALAMTDTSLETGDTFELNADWWNHSTDDLFNAPVFIILDIENSYWFWPRWIPELDHENWNLYAGTFENSINILTFNWPEINGSGGGLKFWAAITSQDYLSIIGSYDVLEWEYL